MRIQYVTIGSATSSAWQPIDYKQKAFAVGLAGIISSGASLTWKVQHTFDDLGRLQPFTASRTTTTATVTLPDHGLTAGDSIQVQYAGAPFDGYYAVASVSDQNTFTYTVANSGAAASLPTAQLVAMRVFDNSVLVSQTGRKDANYAFPVTACRLVCTAYTSGKVTLIVTQGV